MGPLGIGFTPPTHGRTALLVGGGVGIAPLAIWQDQLEDDTVVLVGFRDADHAAGGELLRDPRVATDDGSAGHHGLVTELLVETLHDSSHAVVYACGPPPMLEAVRALCAERDVPAQLAMESGMACGYRRLLRLRGADDRRLHPAVRGRPGHGGGAPSRPR